MLEHRGVPQANFSLDKYLITSCLPLVVSIGNCIFLLSKPVVCITIETDSSVEVMSSFLTNTLCFLAYMMWSETIEQYAEAQPLEKGAMFVRA